MMKNLFAKLKKSWYLVVIAGLIAALGYSQMRVDKRSADVTTLKAKLKTQQAEWTAERKLLIQKGKEDSARYVQQQKDALNTFVDAFSKRETIIVRATNTVKEYEKTDASHTRCIDAEWVRRLQENRAALFPGTYIATEGSPGTMLPR